MPSRKTKNVDEGMTTTPVSNQEQKQADSVAADVEAVDAACVGGSAVVEADRPCHIYVATLKGTDKRYVGITTQRVKARWRDHVKEMRTDSNRHFIRGLRKYGPDAFEWEWLGTLESWGEGCDAERFFIARGWTHYNETDGGEGSPGYKWTDEQKKRRSDAQPIITRETRRKMGANRKGIPSPRKGTKCSDATRQLMSDSAKGRKHSTDQIEKIRISSTGRKHTAETKEKIRLIRLGVPHTQERKDNISMARKGQKPANTGKKRSAETCRKISEAQKGKTLTPEHKAKIGKALTGQFREPHTEDAKRRISASLQGNVPWNKGKELSDEHCKALSDSHKGKKQTPEVIAKRTASRLATLARKKEQKILEISMGSTPVEVILDG
jgi:group I intron endonuclease